MAARKAAKKDEAPPQANTIDTVTAAALLKITPQWVRQLAAQGWYKPIARDRWNLVEVVQGYIDSLKDENRRSAKSAAESRVRDARAAEIERRLAREDRGLIALDEAVRFVDLISGDFLQSIGGLPARITRVPRERQRIESICDAERLRLSDLYAERRQTLRTGRPAAEADDEDDA